MPAVRRFAIAWLALVCSVAAAAPARAALPPVKHVFVIVLENEDYATSFGASSPAPYLAKTLPSMGALIPNYYGIGHESLDNYVAMVSGQGPNPVTQADCPFFTDVTPGTVGADGQAAGSGCVYPTAVKTIADQLEAKQLQWRGYMEDMGNGPADQKTCRHPSANQSDPTQSARQGDQYAARHNPFVYFHSLIDGTSCKQYDVDFRQMPTEIAHADTTPVFSFITPNLCHDGHDAPCKGSSEPGGLKSANDFLANWVPAILASPGYADNGMLIVTFDEAASDNTSCCNERAANTPNAAGPEPGSGGGKVGAVVISPFTAPGSVDQTPYNHYGLLRGLEDLFGLPHLGYAAQDGLEPLGPKVLGQTPALTIHVTARRLDRRRVRFAIDAGRAVSVAFSGACAAQPRQTLDTGRLTVTIRQRRGGRCRITATRDAWTAGVRGFRLRAPR
jgi:phosphatidylinositol-3-phosphatase